MCCNFAIWLHCYKSAHRSEKCDRVQITIELPWSAEKALQQLGRVHRANQVNECLVELFFKSERIGYVLNEARRTGTCGWKEDQEGF